MKSALKYALLIGLIAIAGCASFQNNLGSEKLLTQAATMKVIEADKTHMQARAQKIKAIASDAKSFFDTGTADVNTLAGELVKRVTPLNLQPSDRLLADALIQTIVGELQARAANIASAATNGVQPQSAVYQVSTVLGWVSDACDFYIEKS